MMKKWLFSDNGKIIGPLGLTQSQALIKKHPSLYAWNPAQTHWMPVSHIEEFDMVMDIPPPPLDVPQDFIEKFINDERKLIAQLGSLDENIDLSHSEVSTLATDTQHYQQLTSDLNEKVKAVVSNIEQQYAALEKSLANVSSNGQQ